ncbi:MULTISPECIES: glutathione S-transferase family protein [unclassified Sphingomonas]|uniref:glutathione S-transferase family protein n=1 Tax=unclassified Sphingomonas TaxID=196159 RepID=UPI00083226CA|nr:MULTISPECIES: glutathione S-transferase [unclassified Sphingomonas]
MTLTLYTNPMSRGRIARWALEEAGAEYDTVVIDYGPRAPEFLAVNPMGKVPTIVHDGVVVTECAAICAYLADAFPAAKLAPPVDARGAYYRWLFFAAGPLEQAVTSRSMGWDVGDDPQKQGMLGFGNYDRTIDTLDAAVSAAGDGWLAADHFTAADLYVGAHLSWGTQFDTIPKRESFVAFAARVQAREAAQRANALDDALMPAPAEG